MINLIAFGVDKPPSFNQNQSYLDNRDQNNFLNNKYLISSVYLYLKW